MGLLRLILAAAIVLWHGGTIAGYRYMDPQVCIHAFYIISGFYMALILHEKYQGKGSYRLFLSNRLLRIYPVYFVILGLTILTYPLLVHIHAETLLDPLRGKVGFAELVANLTIIGSWSYFTMDARDPMPLVVPPAWTLGLELLFYAVAPYIVRLRLRYLVPIAVFSIILRKILLYPRFATGQFVPNRFIGSELCFFLLGVVSYRLLHHVSKRHTHLHGAMSAAIIVSTLLYQYAASVVHPTSAVEWVYYALVSVCVPFLFWSTRSNRFDKILGELAYPVYLSNMLVIWIAKPLFSGTFGTMSSIFFLVSTIIVSWVLAVVIDRPVNRFRQARSTLAVDRGGSDTDIM